MAYIGIGYSGHTKGFLQDLANQHMQWLKADRLPHFYGDSFVVMYDSNTAREFAKKAKLAAEKNTITVYPMKKPVEE
jgi:hypothetical protein